jgi:hypothetical protein
MTSHTTSPGVRPRAPLAQVARGPRLNYLKSGLDFLNPGMHTGPRIFNKGVAMAQWNELTSVTGDRPFAVTAVRLAGSDITINGEFELPPLAGLRWEDQVFVSEFVRCHGSIKYMEKAFGISYPTVKNRLNKIVAQLQLVEVVPVTDHDEVFELLEKGEISVDQATERLKK